MSSKIARDLAKTVKERQDAFNLPVSGLVTTVLPELDALKVEQYGHPGTFTVPVRHPYLGARSWIRVAPDEGTQCLVQQRGDLAEAVLQGYFSSNQARRSSAGEAGKIVYRRLSTGEIEVMSKGRAYLHFGLKGDLSMLGGVVQQQLSQSELEWTSTAPTHVRRMHLATPSTQQYLERFGYVKRPDQTKQSAFQRYIKQDDDTYSFEYSRWLAKKDGKGLVSVQEGHVIDENGSVVNSSANKPLRYLRVITDASGNETLRIEIDDALNYTVTNSSTSATTFQHTAGTQGEVKASGKKWSADYTDAVMLSSGTTATMKGTSKAVVQAPQVELGQGALQSITIAPTLQNSVLIPMLSGLMAVCTALQAEVALTGTKAAAASAVTTLTSAMAQVQNIASQTVKASP
jgi:hypothetical protein